MKKIGLKLVLVAALLSGMSGCSKRSSLEQPAGREEQEAENYSGTAGTPAATGSDAAEPAAGQPEAEQQVRYRSEYTQIEWDAEQFSCGYAGTDSIGLIGWHSIPGEDGSASREYIMNIVDTTAGNSGSAQHSVVLQIPGNWSIQKAAGNGNSVWFLADEVATKENPDASELYLAGCGKDGALLFQKELSAVLKAEDAKVSSFTLDRDGNVWLQETLSRNIYCLAADEEELRQIEGNGKPIEDFIFDKAQNLYGKSCDEEENWNLWQLDAADGFSAKPLVIEDAQIREIKPGIDTDFLLLKEKELAGYEIASQEEKTICSLTDMGLQAADIYDFAGMENGAVAMLLAAMGTADARIAWITPKEAPASGMPDWESGTITVACLEADSMLRDLIAAFNRTGSSNIAVIKEYYDPFQSDATKEDALRRLNADLADGTAGDVLDFIGLAEYAVRSQYADLGLLEELYAWIDNDSEIEREDYLQPLWKANEIDGGLYNLVALYDVNTKICADSQVGEGYHLDLDWMLSQVNPVKVFGSHYTRDEFFHDLCVFWLSDRKNVENSVLFDTETMQEVLAFAKSIPQERDEIWGIMNSDELYFGEMLLQTTGWAYGDGMRRDLNSCRSVAAALGKKSGINEITPLLAEMGCPYTEKDAAVLGSFAAPVSLIGFPVQEGAGSSYVSRISLGICKGSQNKEGAWELLRYTLSDEAQRSRGEFETLSIPVKQSIWKEACEKNSAPENIDVVWSGSELQNREYEVLIPPLSQAMIDEFDGLTAQMTYVDEVDPQLFTILTEEADIYFQGQCSDTAAIEAMQNRVRLYLSETGR